MTANAETCCLQLGSNFSTYVWAQLLMSNLLRCRLLSWLGNEGHPDRALEVFDWLEGRREYVTEVCILYTRLASMYARQKGGLETAMHIFDRMQARGIRPDTVAFNSAITVASELLTAAPCMHGRLSWLHVRPCWMLQSCDQICGACN